MGHHSENHDHHCHHCCDEKDKKDSMYEDIDCEMTRWMLTTADEAWTELFKDKVKKHYESIMGEKIDQMAKAAAEGSMTVHMNQHKQKGDAHKISENIQAAFKTEGKTEE